MGHYLSGYSLFNFIDPECIGKDDGTLKLFSFYMLNSGTYSLYNFLFSGSFDPLNKCRLYKLAPEKIRYQITQ